MNAKEQESYRESLKKFLQAKCGQQVKVCGMWTGDFIGVVVGVGWTQATFRDVLSVGENGVRRVPISIRCRAWRIA